MISRSSLSTNALAHHLVESIEVTDGYLRGARLDFIDGLNCIIGGRGSGKTTVLELLLFALGVTLPASRLEAHEAVLKGTLAAGSVTVRVRTQHGVRYECSRVRGGEPRVTTAEGDRARVSLDGELFRVEVYSQNEIENLATSPAAQLALIDKFIEPAARRLAAEIERKERALAQNASELLRLDREVGDDDARVRELPSIEEALRGLAGMGGPGAGVAKLAFQEKALRARERGSLTDTAEELTGISARAEALARDTRARLARAVEADLDRGRNGDVFGTLAAALRARGPATEEAFAAVRTEIAAAVEAVAAAQRVLAALHVEQDAAYAALVAREDEDRGRTAEQKRLEQQRVEILAVAKRLAEHRREHAARREERAVMLADLARSKEERFALRLQVTRDLSAALAGDVRVSLEPSRDTRAYEALLTDVLRGANIRPASLMKELAAGLRPDELCAIVEANEPTRIMEIDESKTNKAERAQRILDTIRASGRLFEIQTVPLDDVPLIELRTGAVYKPSARVSTGQRCTCILPILLLDTTSPLFIDQPEDNLDNAFIYDVLVKSLLMAKRTRQIVLVTHNANIPVLGDAERVFVMEADGTRGGVREFGNVDEVRGAIEKIVEGGREAFVLRGRRYGHG